MSRILVVDDELPNRALIRGCLDGSGHEVIEVASGQAALDEVARAPVDLILLDVMMPGIDGFEVTRRLRARPAPMFLPIVLVTALSDAESRCTGLAAGADDYVTKPIDPQELLLRVRNLLSLREREQALIEHERFRDAMTALFVHDLRNPLGAMTANLEVAVEDWPDPMALQAVRDCVEACRGMTELVRDVADSHRLEARQMPVRLEPVGLAGLLETVTAGVRDEAALRRLELRVACPDDLVPALDRDLFTRALDNLVHAALRALPPRDVLTLEARADGSAVRIRIGAAQAAMSSRFALGLHFCRLAVAAHGGTVQLDTEPGRPDGFVIEVRGQTWTSRDRV